MSAMSRRAAAALVFGLALMAWIAQARPAAPPRDRPSAAPRHPLRTLLQSDPAAVYDNTTLLAALGSSQAGIKFAVQHDLFHLAEGLPAELLHEPGVSYLAAAVEAYHLFSPAVWLVQQVNAWKLGGQKVAGDIPAAADAGVPNRWWLYTTSVEQKAGRDAPVGNGATRYAFLFFDLDEGPLVFELPPAEAGGFWSVIFLDIYQEMFYTIGTQTNDDAGGRWLLLPPGWTGPTFGFPPSRVVQSATRQGSLFGRVRQDGPGAAAFQKGWRVSVPSGDAVPARSSFGFQFLDPEKALATESSEPLYFWQVAGEVLRTNPKASLADPLRSQLAQLGLSARGGFDAEALPLEAEAALAHAAPVAAACIEARWFGNWEPNGWALHTLQERWGADVLLGAAIVKAFGPLQWVENAAYYVGSVDAQGLALQGASSYRLEFEAPPPAHPLAFWSIQVLDLSQVTYPYPDIFVDTSGYNYGGTLTSLDRRLNITQSGRFSIDISPEPPATLGQPGTNWLRQDFPDAPVQFVFRIYWGDESVRRNIYRLPPIQRLDGAERAVAQA